MVPDAPESRLVLQGTNLDLLPEHRQDHLHGPNPTDCPQIQPLELQELQGEDLMPRRLFYPPRGFPERSLPDTPGGCRSQPTWCLAPFPVFCEELMDDSSAPPRTRPAG